MSTTGRRSRSAAFPASAGMKLILAPLGCLLFLWFPTLSAQTSITGAQIRNPLRPVAALPSTCTPYNVYFLTTSNTAFVCTGANTFTPLAAGSGGDAGLPAQNGTPGYLFTNGTTVSWGNILTGGSGALDCVSTPGRCDVTSIVPLKNSANTWSGVNDFHSALLRLPESTISGLPPASGNTGSEFMVTDGASTCDTTTGGGSTRVLVQSTGVSYVAPNCSTGGGGGGASSTSQLTDFALTLSNGTLTIQPGRIRFGTMPCTNFTTSSTAFITSMVGGTGVAKLYISSTCALVLQYPNSLTVTWTLSGLTTQPVVTPTVPSDAWYMADVNLGPSAIAAFSEKRAIPGMDTTKAGSGIVEDCTLGPCLISTDPAVIPTLGGVNAYTGTQDNTAATITKPSRTVPSDPSGSCTQNNEIVLSTSSGDSFSCLAGTWHAMGGGGSILYPSGGVPNSTGSAWGASYTVGTAANNLVQLTSGAKLPAVDGSLLTNLPSSGGGGSSQYLTTGSGQIITDSGDYIIAATTPLPALPAGACWDYETFFITLPNINPTALKLWFGTGMSVGSDYNSGSFLESGVHGTSQQLAYRMRGQICNNNGTQSAQTATIVTDMGSNTLGYTLIASTPYSTPWTINTAATNLQIGISWAGPDGLKVQSFRVWRAQ